MIILIILIGLVFRLVGLNQSLWLDEAITAEAVSKFSFWEIITKYSPGDFHPPLYYLFLKAWSDIFGTSEIALRFPSVIFSLATVCLVYLIGKKLWDKKAGLLAAAFFAVNPLVIYYSQEARMYSLVTMLVSLAMWGLVTKRWPLFVISYLLAIYTDYLPIFLLPVFFFFVPKKVLVPVLALFAPWGLVVWQQFQVAGSSLSQNPEWGRVLGSFDIKALPLTFVKFIVGRISIANKYLYGLTMLVTGSIYLYVLIKARSKFIWLWLLTPLLIGIAISTILPIYSYFRFLFVVPAFCLLLAAGSKNSKWLASSILIISLISITIFNSEVSFQRESWRDGVREMNKSEGLILMPSIAQSSPLRYYGAKWEVSDKIDSIGSTNKVYLLRYVQEIFDPTDELRKTLEVQGYERVNEQNFNSLVIWTYEYKAAN